MHPLLIALVTVGVFAGMTLSFYVGWYADEWIVKIFSIRMRTTPTHVTFEYANSREIEKHRYEKLRDFLTNNEIRARNSDQEPDPYLEELKRDPVRSKYWLSPPDSYDVRNI